VVVAPDRDGFREQIISGQTGLLYDPATPGALTAALAAALDLGPAQRSRMREAACRRVIATRDVIRNLAETLRRILPRQPPPRGNLGPTRRIPHGYPAAPRSRSTAERILSIPLPALVPWSR